MKREEVAYLNARLVELADYYGHKPPSTAAIKIWADCLEGQQWADVASVLTDWPKAKRSFPLGDEVRKLAAERVSTRLEEESRRNNAAAPAIESILAEDTPNARAFKRMWTAWRTKKVSSPREWCNNVLASDKADAELKAFASEAVGLMGKEKTRRGKYWFEEEANEA